MVLTELKLNEKWDKNQCEKLIRYYSIQYLRYFFADRKNKDEIKKLNSLNFGTKSPIYNILISIINNLYIKPNNKLYINNNRLYNEKIENIYRLVKYGNLTYNGSSIIDDSIIFGIKRMMMRKKYGG